MGPAGEVDETALPSVPNALLGKPVLRLDGIECCWQPSVIRSVLRDEAVEKPNAGNGFVLPYDVGRPPNALGRRLLGGEERHAEDESQHEGHSFTLCETGHSWRDDLCCRGLTVGVSGEHSEAVRVHCTPG